jgi:DNA-binding XRE family transcriptional regulator
VYHTRYPDLKDLISQRRDEAPDFPIGVIWERVCACFPIGKDRTDLGEIFLYGKTYQEMFDVQVRTRFRRCHSRKRKALGWTQTELAARSGTGERFIVELESGKPSCQLEKSLIVARTVGIDIGDLSTVQDTPTSPDDDLDFLPTFGDG